MRNIERKYGRMKTRLVSKMQPLLKSYGIEKETIVDAIEKSLWEINGAGRNIQPWLLSLIFWKIFDDKCFLLIKPRTPAGNAVSFDVLAAAHAMWREAQQVAATRGMDGIDAAEALISVVNFIADRIAHGNCASIRDIPKYMFSGYVNELKRNAGKIGIVRLHELNPADAPSDEGAFIKKVENRILRDEILAILPEREKDVAIFHYIMGYSCEETATKMALSYSAVRKILSRDMKKHAESVCGNRKRRVTRKRSTQEKGGHNETGAANG